jgi:hypothetical protein
MPRAKLRASSKAPSPPASGSRNVHNQATNFSVLKRDLHALVLHVFKDLNCYEKREMMNPRRLAPVEEKEDNFTWIALFYFRQLVFVWLSRLNRILASNQ